MGMRVLPLLLLALIAHAQSVTPRPGPELAKLSLEQPARVGGPVWLHVELSSGELRYPKNAEPSDFGCHDIEVRRDGQLLPRIAGGQPSFGFNGSGSLCGSTGLPGPAIHKHRLPLHLQYRFAKPGVYEVQYAFRPPQIGLGQPELVSYSAWTRIEILPGPPAAPGPPPADPVEALTDYLPSILGFPDDAHLALVTGYLYHPTDLVRRYAAAGLSYWPTEKVDRLLVDLLRKRGPSDVIAWQTYRTPGAMNSILPYLKSDDSVLLGGAVTGASRLLLYDPQLLTPEDRARVKEALLAAAENVPRHGSRQTQLDYAGVLRRMDEAPRNFPDRSK